MPSLTLSSNALTFASTYVGFPAASVSLTATNNSSAAISFSNPTLSTPDYTATNNCPASVAPQTYCTLWVVFTPSAAGSGNASLSVNGISASLTGEGVPNPPATFNAALNQSSVFMGASIVQYWPMPIHDAGIAGQVTSQMLARFQTDILGHGYTRVIILGGSNDLIDALPGLPDELIQNLQAMGQMATNAGMEVVLNELPPSTRLDSNGVSISTKLPNVNAAIRQLAIQQGYLLVDQYTPLLPYPQYFPDGLHPNAAGYAIMEQQLAGVVQR